MNQLAKALYDNTAECADELAFRRGDIMTVVEQSVAGTSGWWMCSLYGRHGLAPANRLQLLPLVGPAGAAATPPPLGPATENPAALPAHTDQAQHNIYQIPSVPRASCNTTYERMDVIYKVPLATSPPSRGPATAAPKLHAVGSQWQSPTAPVQVYDVPSPARASTSVFAAPGLVGPTQGLEKRSDSPGRSSCGSPEDSYVYAVPPPVHQDPNYDVPVPSAAETQQQHVSGFNAPASPRKPEWIYDVPVALERQSPPRGPYGTAPSKGVGRQLLEVPGGASGTHGRSSPISSLYDVPKPTSPEAASPPKLLPRAPIYDRPPTQRASEEPLCASPGRGEHPAGVLGDHLTDHIPLECRGDCGRACELKRVRLQRMRNFLACTSFHDLQAGGPLLGGDSGEPVKSSGPPARDSPRVSTASISSTSSCDSLTLSSSSPEPLREVTLSQDEACRRLLELQEAVCAAVPQLMDFVSSHWRSREHLEKHLERIREAAGGITRSLSCFLSFSLDIKGNARRLTESSFQARLNKQLSIVEDSGVILQQTFSALNSAGWPLSTLCQDPGQVQTPDQLERFVMVARTVPEDVKRLVSIINANGKLLFKPAQKEAERRSNQVLVEANRNSLESNQQPGPSDDPGDSDYVELQTKSHFEMQQKKLKENIATISKKTQVGTESGSGTEDGGGGGGSSSLSEHCRLYFGALQKAIGGFVGSLQDGQPPEKFISQSKLVIMVGQRLVNTLCTEAQRAPASQSLLCKSNHLCALLKQLAVATKKAALHFPERQALHEAQEFARELAQRAQHFRISLDI